MRAGALFEPARARTHAENNQHAIDSGLRQTGIPIVRKDPAGLIPDVTYATIKEAAAANSISSARLKLVRDHPSWRAKGYEWVTAGDAREDAIEPKVTTRPEHESDMTWSTLNGCDGLVFRAAYEISDQGHVRKPGLDALVTTRMHPDGYVEVSLRLNDNRSRRFFVHRLVAAAFHPCEASEAKDVDHIDGNRANNDANNLQYLTRGAHNKKTHGKTILIVDPKTGEVKSRYFTVAEAAKGLRLSEATVRRRLKDPTSGVMYESAPSPSPQKQASAEHLTDADIDEILLSLCAGTAEGV